jgi:hypothetical protein
MPGEQFRLPRASKLKYRHTFQGRIQDFKLGGGVLKKIAPSGERREHFWGISCEKSRFYAKKSYFFSIAEGGAKIFEVFRVKNHDFTPKNPASAPPPLNPTLHLNLSHCIL